VSQDRHFRAYGRRRVDLSASLRRPTHNGDEPIRILDLSLAGACIEVDQPLSPGTRVRMEITAPSLWDPVVVRCRAVWSGAPSTSRSGLSFEHSDSALVFALFELLEAHAYQS
jgi:PilZ domain